MTLTLVRHHSYYIAAPGCEILLRHIYGACAIVALPHVEAVKRLAAAHGWEIEIVERAKK